jgi:hypothetical protein
MWRGISAVLAKKTETVWTKINLAQSTDGTAGWLIDNPVEYEKIKFRKIPSQLPTVLR